jgi:iron(III) transport system substrate-binding protein
MRHSRPLVVGLPVLAAVLALAACGSTAKKTGASTPKVVTLTLYNGQHEETTSALVKAFTAKTGIKVTVRSDDEDVLGDQIAQEGSHGRADVFYTENTPVLARLDAQHRLAPVDDSSLAVVPAADSAADKRWLGVSARVAALVYNTDKLKPTDLPTSVLDLANRKYKGQVDVSPGETDFQPVVTSVVAKDGKDAAVKWLKGVKANIPDPPAQDNETLVADVNKGTTDFGLINSYYWYRLQAELGQAKMHSAIAYFAPKDPGYLKNVSGVAVVAASKHPVEAQRLVAFLVSAEGEKVLADSDSFEYPLGSGAAANTGLPALSTLQPTDLSLEALGGAQEAVKLLQQVGLL